MDASEVQNEEGPSGTMSVVAVCRMGVDDWQALGGRTGTASLEAFVIARIGSALLVAALAGSVAACVSGGTGPTSGSPPSSTTPARPPASAKFVPGLYDLADGSVQALGTLEYRDIEGGTWVMVGGSDLAGDAGKTVAVIANAADFAAKLESLKGAQVVATGQRLDGASIRMAGPEMTITAIDGATQSSSEAQ